MQLLKTFKNYKSLKNIFTGQNRSKIETSTLSLNTNVVIKKSVSYSSSNSIRSSVKKDTKSTVSYGKIIQKHTVFLTTTISKL